MVGKLRNFQVAVSQKHRRKVGPKSQWRTNKKSHRTCAFNWYHHRPWMTLNGRHALYDSKDASFRVGHKNMNEGRHILSAAEM